MAGGSCVSVGGLKVGEGKQILKKGQAGSRGGCLKRGGGAGTLLRTMGLCETFVTILCGWCFRG